MGFPDRIERTVELAKPPPQVWAALTTDAGLSAWFSDEASVDLRPGGALRLRWKEGYAPTMRVERVEPPAVFGFSWPQGPDTGLDATPRTYVEFTLEAHGEGTRLTVVESGFAQLPDAEYRSTYDDHTEGWRSELGELVGYCAR